MPLKCPCASLHLASCDKKRRFCDSQNLAGNFKNVLLLSRFLQIYINSHKGNLNERLVAKELEKFSYQATAHL